MWSLNFANVGSALGIGLGYRTFTITSSAVGSAGFDGSYARALKHLNISSMNLGGIHLTSTGDLYAAFSFKVATKS